ncbi:hypothetical protein CACET_c14510 [Clostridium aceticum]|uniref:Uncharacterized protein n=1 Tax=Clostridium aceticum TaxID=84022 RepID=A0A0G3WAK3_9CLOT|nr:hypothetical protein [Clostridium aceticum]AKL94915.1 hypothetical protein CACET_c14510 [Clostridium aceticum]
MIKLTSEKRICFIGKSGDLLLFLKELSFNHKEFKELQTVKSYSHKSIEILK